MVDFITNFFRNTKTYRRLALHFFTLLWVSVLLTFIPFIKALFINVKHFGILPADLSHDAPFSTLIHAVKSG